MQPYNTQVKYTLPVKNTFNFSRWEGNNFWILCVNETGLGPDGKIHEVPGPKVKPISGLCVFDNHSVNLLSTILTGILLPQLTCGLMWS